MEQRQKMDFFINKRIKSLFLAAQNNQASRIKKCLTHGIDANCFEDSDNITPLHVAVIFKAYSAATVLIEAGANPLAKNIEGITPLELANEIQDRKMIGIISTALVVKKLIY